MKIKFTRAKNLLGETIYLWENDTHRYVTFQENGWWLSEVYILERVGLAEPPLMVRGRQVDVLMDLTLKGVREEIVLDVEKRS